MSSFAVTKSPDLKPSVQAEKSEVAKLELGSLKSVQRETKSNSLTLSPENTLSAAGQSSFTLRFRHNAEASLKPSELTLGDCRDAARKALA